MAATSPLALRVQQLSHSKLAAANMAVLNPGDFAALAAVGAGEALPRTMWVTLSAHGAPACLVVVVTWRDSVQAGTVQLNVLHRKTCRLALEDLVDVAAFPLEGCPPLSSVQLDADVLGRAGGGLPLVLDAASVTASVTQAMAGHVVRVGQEFAVAHARADGTAPLMLKFVVVAMERVVAAPQAPCVTDDRFAVLTKATSVSVQGVPGGGLRIAGGTRTTARLFDAGFSFESLGIGGLNREFAQIFRRAFASRLYPGLMRDMGMNHVRGMLLYGPPGCGKTLIARKIGQALHAKEPKKVNGPEILNKYVGQSEENIRALFREAEEDQRTLGDDSELHIIIFDEIDAICRQRGSGAGGGGAGAAVGDSIVNQLLSKIDGVDSLNNILLIGMTNRRDLIDDALLRPGRLEVHVEIGLPDGEGRRAILGIHTAAAAATGHLGPDVDLDALAGATPNFTGAELEGLVRDAGSHALLRVSDHRDLTRAVDASGLVLTAPDFAAALAETTPQFGMREGDLAACCAGGVIPFGPRVEALAADLAACCAQLRDPGGRVAALAVVVTGPPGAGKSAAVAAAALAAGVPCVKRVGPDALVGLGDTAKAGVLHRAFEDVGRVPLGVVVLDDLERLLEYVPLGCRFSNVVLQTLVGVLARPPAPGHRVLVLATATDPDLLRDLGLWDLFHVALVCPLVATPLEVQAVVQAGAPCACSDPEVVATVAAAVTCPVPVKKLLTALEVARADPGVVRDPVAAFCLACTKCGVSTNTAPAGAPRPGVPA
jgi:vesicle-fusing ATPase